MAKKELIDALSSRVIEVGIENHQYVDNKIVSAKYTLWNFLPKNLYAQFRRVANFYFLLVTLLTLFIDSPVAPWTSVLPLLIVVSVSALKQAYEDWLRRKSDKRINSASVKILKNGEMEEMACRHIRVGDIVRVDSESDVPCDLVLLMTTREDSKCFVTTANLDGETNLKSLECPLFRYVSRNGIDGLRGTLECEQPTIDLYTFRGQLTVDLLTTDVLGHPAEFAEFEKISHDNSINQALVTQRFKVSLSANNLVLRGSRLKNTDFILGCAVYTGHDTKLAYNSQIAHHKTATSEKAINFYLLFFFSLLVLEVVISVVMDYYEANHSESRIYLGKWSGYTVESLLNEFFSYVVLYYYIIPISLYVTIEVQKFLGSLYIKWDTKMFHNDIGAEANTSDINEDLGQVEYLFTDKTGTLTENVMTFRFFSCGSTIYSEVDGKLYMQEEKSDCQVTTLSELADQLLLAMAICHTVQCSDSVEVNTARLTHDLPKYEASSADEKALVEAAARCGYIYLGEENNVIYVRVKERTRKFLKRKVFEFTSERKRMSIVVTDETDETILFCKGAESNVASIVSKGLLEECLESANRFSRRGLRALLFGYRIVGRDWLEQQAGTLEDTEKELTVLGVTAVEDHLQPNVEATLKALSQANIRVWILTGDRLETASAVALSCRHFTPSTPQFKIVSNDLMCSLEDHLRTVKESAFNLDGPFYLIIDGKSLTLASQSQETLNLFLEIALQAQSVLCCRLAPKQKAQIVHMVKQTKFRPVTAAIGDGGNDVAMILEAHIGIGLIGREGRQAANNADFVLPTFSGLQRLFLVHGHWYYRRLAILVQYFFYKNMVFITPQVFFAIHNGVSPQPLYSSVFFLLYNTAFTALPVIVYSLFEQDYPEKLLLERPNLYIIHRKNVLLSAANFLTWVFDGVWHSSVVYFFPCILIMHNPSIMLHDNPIDLGGFGTIVIHLCIIVVNLKLVLECQYQTVFFIVSILLSILGFITFTMLYNLFDISLLDPLHGVYTKLVISPSFWLLTILAIVTCLLPDITIKVLKTVIKSQMNQRKNVVMTEF